MFPLCSNYCNLTNFPLLILTFSGHVIPAENLLSVALDKGPAGKEFDFTFQSRDSPDLVRSIPLMLSCVHFSSISLVRSGLKCKNLSIFSEVEQKSLPDFNSDIFFKLNFEVSSLPVFWRQFIVKHMETIFHCWSPF